MAETEKPAKNLAEVDTTAKPVIVTNRAIIKDPTEDTSSPTDSSTEITVRSAAPVLQPLEPNLSAPKVNIEPEVKSAAEPAPETTPVKADEEAVRVEHDATIQKLIDGKQYELPIDTVEKRKSRQFVIAGVILSVVLLVAWADIALDAGLIQIGNVKPVTHFFSN